MFKTNEANLTHAAEVCEHFGECWLHGDGNVYHKKAASQFKADFSNPGPSNTKPAASYWVHFTNVTQIPEATPAGLKRLERMFMENFNRIVTEEANKVTPNAYEPVVLPQKPISVAPANTGTKPVTHDLSINKDAILNAREEQLDNLELELANKESAIAGTENMLKSQQNRLSEIEQKLIDREKELNKKEAALAKKAAGTTPANS